jgi:asparagine N-glycosylation enzyme membrane subunit Stt3
MLVGRGVVDASAHAHWARDDSHIKKGAIAMLYTIAVVLLIAWLLGFVGIYTVGAFVHVLLVVAIVLFLVGSLSGRRTLV